MENIKTAFEYMRRWWGMMLDYGATTCWETFPGFEKGRLTRSHCHAWSAAPGYFLGAYVLGVRSQRPGFKTIILEPNPCGLEWAKGSVPVPGGRIDVEWNICEGEMNIMARIPKHIKVKMSADKRKMNLKKVIYSIIKI